jgi:hypothetical protein
MSLAIEGITSSGSSSTGLIANALSSKFKVSFHNTRMFMYRFLQDSVFQIDDMFWRAHTNMIFDFLTEQNNLKYNDNITINVDYTTINNDFLILAASINVGEEKDIILYFSMRNYPKRKNQMDQKKMESSFFKGLKHILSKKYTYTIVADRGFGNLRTINMLEELGFTYVLRINEDLRILTHNEISINLKEYDGKNARVNGHVIKWDKDINFEIKTKNNSTWYIATNLEKQRDTAEIYEKRFKIEKMFQDIKSEGYDIESTRIRKYDRMKRMLYLVLLSHALSVFLGWFVKHCKKNFTNHWEIAIASIHLENRYLEPVS